MFLVHLQVLEEPVFIRLAERSHSRSPHHSEEDEEDASDKEEDSEEDDSEEDDSWETLCQDTITPHEPIRPPSGDDPDPPTLGEVLLTVLDWYVYTRRINRRTLPPRTCTRYLSWWSPKARQLAPSSNSELCWTHIASRPARCTMLALKAALSITILPASCNRTSMATWTSVRTVNPHAT